MEKYKMIAQSSNLRDIKVGDSVYRYFSECPPMELKVSKIDDTRIYCGDYAFCKFTGGEIDEELGWGKVNAQHEMWTGSYIRREKV